MRASQVFKKCQVFYGLSDAHLDRLAAITEEKEYSAGTTIFQEGGDSDEFFVVEDGKVALQMTLPEGSEWPVKRVTVDIIGPNEILGWSAIVEPFVYTLTAVCLQKTKVLSINALNLRMLLKNDQYISHGLSKGLIRVIADRLATTRHVLISERLLSPVELIKGGRSV